MKLTLEKMKQKISELELKNSLLKYKNKTLNQVIDSAVPFCIVDKDNNVLKVNSSFCLNFGFKEKEVLGRKCYNIWQNKICKTPNCPLESILNGQKFCECEIECELSSGKIHQCIVKAKPYHDLTGKLVGVTESFVDVSDLKRAEEALREQDEHWHAVIQNMPVLMIAFGKDENIIVWNKGCERITGFSSDEILGNSGAFELLYPDEKYRRLVADKLTQPENDYHNWEFDIYCKDGSAKTVAWFNISTSFPVPGWLSWVLGIDVTERTLGEKALRMRERDLMGKKSELEKMNTALNVLLEKRESDKSEIESRISMNVNMLINPLFDKLFAARLNNKQETYARSIRTCLHNITSSFAKELTDSRYGLTLTELIVANYVCDGKSSKEIAEVMHLSKRTIDVHRTHIRKKIGPALSETNLRAFLMTLS